MQALKQYRMYGAWALLAGTLALAGCGSTSSTYNNAPGNFPQRPPTSVAPPPAAHLESTLPAETAPPSTAAEPIGVHVALLAPLTGVNADRGTALVQAAKLALDQPNAPQLDVLDTQSTAEGAATASSAAVASGVGLILGPLTAAETAAAAAPAMNAHIPLLAFTSDATQQRPGVWVLGLTPAQQVSRLVAATKAEGKSHFVALLPSSDFGRAMGDALAAATTAAGLAPPDIHTIDDSMATANQTVREIADYRSRRGPLDAQIKAARAKQTPEGRKEAAELLKRPIPPPPFDALLLSATGDTLGQIASLLPYYDIDAPTVRVLGPALWANPAARAGASLNGAWYAAPDPAMRAEFNQLYTAKYGAPAPGLADLAYDAAAIARVTAAGGGFSPASLTRPEGFAGVNGVLALLPDGSVRRGLAVFEIQKGAAKIVDPAPDSLGAPGS